MKSQIFIVCFFLISFFANAQTKVLTLEESQQKAYDNYPLIEQFKFLEQTEEYNLDNLSKIYLPQFSIEGQATYQTDVVKIKLRNLPLEPPVDLGHYLPEIDKDQYRVSVNVQQLIWDGGRKKSQEEVIKSNVELEKQKNEVTLYGIKERINELYFGILSIDEQLKQLDLLQSDLEINDKMLHSMFKNGVAMQSDLDRLSIEFLNLEQKRTELRAYRESFLSVLSIFIQEPLNEETKLIIPEDSEIALSEEIYRPEINLFQKQREVFENQNSTIKSKNNPILGAFVQGGYGKPGLNMLDNKFDFYAIGGIKFTWDFGQLYTNKNEKALIQTNLSMVDVQEKTFLFNTRLQLNQKIPEIEKYKDLLAKDDKIIELRNSVKKSSQSKFKNGVYLINDLMQDINAENQSRQMKALHYIQYVKSIYDYKNIQGK